MNRPIPGPLLASGRSADVYLVGENKVLRRYRADAVEDFDAEREARLLMHVREHGFPVPEVFDADRTDLVMERIHGPSMLSSVAKRPWTLSARARTLATLHDQLHRIPVPPGLATPFGDAEALLHLDLHPENVLMTEERAIVIDWQNAAAGPAGADLAKTWIILATAVVPASGVKGMVLRGARRQFLGRFLHRVDEPAARSSLSVVAAAWVANPRVGDIEREATGRLLRHVTPISN
jgi:aminoglycoside phosphotransferase (APT) family kinase protein